MNGLSVLIPIYNFDISKLLHAIHSQLLMCNIAFEIRLYDDASTDDCKVLNHKVQALQNVVYQELAKNIGRSKIRNLLTQDAVYDTLLFMDCDNEIVHQDYISKIFRYPLGAFAVIVGGTCYAVNPPLDSKYYLHWLVGKHKEEKPASKRNINPYNSFTLNNMVINKEVYLNVLLDENITTYGHEDSKFGVELRLRNYKLLHVDNPICHIGLNENKDFLKKSLQAIDNLCTMINNDGIGTDTRLYQAYLLLKGYKLIQAFYYFTKKLEGLMYRNLVSSKPSLIVFDIFKLNYLVYKLGDF